MLFQTIIQYFELFIAINNNVSYFQRSLVNRYALHTLTPLTQIETTMYSSSSGSLTGNNKFLQQSIHIILN